MRFSQGAALLAVGLLAGVTACSDAQGQGQEGRELSAESARESPRYAVAYALAQLPQVNVEGPVTIQTSDLTSASAAAGLERATDVDGVHQWLDPLLGQPTAGVFAPVFVPLATLFNAPRLQDHGEFVAELGWSLIDVDWFVELSTPPETFTVVAGDFDETSLAIDLVDVGDGVVSAGEGDDYELDLTDTTVARPTGMPLRVARAEGLIAASPATDLVGGWAASTVSTFADHAELAAVAAALDDANVVSAMLVTGASASIADVAGAGGPAELGSLLPADPFDTVGIGWAAEDGAGVTVVYHFASEDAATAAVPAFESVLADATLLSGDPLSQVLTLEDATHEGQVVVLTLAAPSTQSPAFIADLLMNRDVPFLHQ